MAVLRLVPFALLALLAACGDRGAETPSSAPATTATAPTPPSPPPPAALAEEIVALDHFGAHHDQTTVLHALGDGLVVTAGLDGVARVWNVVASPPLVAVLEGHVGSIHHVASKRDADGVWILTSSVDETARLWRLEEGRVVRSTRLLGHGREVLEGGFLSRGGDPVIWTFSLDGSARLWSADGRKIARLDAKHAPIAGVVASPSGERLLLLAPEGAARLVDTRGQTVHEFAGEAASAEGALFSNDGRRLLLYGPEGPPRLFDRDGTTVATLEGHRAQVLDAACSPTGLLATASLDATVRLWSADGAPLARLEGHGGAVHQVSFSPDGALVLTTASDRKVRLWGTDGHAVADFGGSDSPLVAAAFSPDGDRVLARPFERGPARVYDLAGHLRLVAEGPTDRAVMVSYVPGAPAIVTVDRDLTPHAFRTDESGGTGTAAAAPPWGADGDVPHRGDYAGTVACARCHLEAYEGWAASSHARTSTFANAVDLPREVQEGETVRHPPGWSRFGGDVEHGWWVETLNEHGEVQRYPMTIVAGHLRIRFFVTKMPDGRLQVLPGMLEVPTGEWFDYTDLIFGAPMPDFMTPPVVKPGDRSFWTGPVRSWDAKCAQCHMSGKVPREPGPDGVGPRITWRAYAVDCEACHGPGRNHAEAWARLEMDRPLRRLETLDRNGRTHVCTRCHQEGEVLDPPYRMGQDLYEYIDPTLVIDPERADPSGRSLELIYDGLPFSTSACANAGGLTCSTCHAPHGSDEPSLLRHPHEDGSFCVECHRAYVEEPQSHTHHDPEDAGGTCVACHMPFLTIERGHGAVADHTIGIPRIGLVADRVQTDACTWCHQGGRNAPGGVPTLETAALAEAYEGWWPGRGWPRPWMAALAKARTATPGAWRDLVEVLGSDAPREARASAALLLGRYPDEAAAAILEASRSDDSLIRRSAVKALADVRSPAANARLLDALSDPSWAVRLAAARTSLDGWERARANRPLLMALLPVLEEDARRVPDDDQRWFRLGAAFDLAGDREGALRAYERELALDPFADAVREYVGRLRQGR